MDLVVAGTCPVLSPHGCTRFSSRDVGPGILSTGPIHSTIVFLDFSIRLFYLTADGSSKFRVFLHFLADHLCKVSRCAFFFHIDCFKEAAGQSFAAAASRSVRPVLGIRDSAVHHDHGQHVARLAWAYAAANINCFKEAAGGVGFCNWPSRGSSRCRSGHVLRSPSPPHFTSTPTYGHFAAAASPALYRYVVRGCQDRGMMFQLCI